MRKRNLTEMSVDELVERFKQIALAQDAADLRDEITKYNRLFDLMGDVEEELKQRPGDQRRALVSLFDHPNPQVRVKAAIRALAVAPKAAREALEILDERNELPQAADARGILWGLDDGTYKPT